MDANANFVADFDAGEIQQRGVENDSLRISDLGSGFGHRVILCFTAEKESRLTSQPRIAISPNERDRFLDRVYAVRDGEIDFARELVSFLQHRTAAPFEEIGPHFPDEDERRVVMLAHLEELPHDDNSKSVPMPPGPTMNASEMIMK